jgi:hypothetical protein
VERLLECEDENSLHLRGLGEFSLQALFALLPFKRSVTALKLSLLRKAPLRVCCEKLAENLTLTRIDLSGNKVLPRGCAWLAAALDTNETLTSIALNDAGLCRKGNYAGLCALSRRLRKRDSKIRQLELARNGLKATGIKVVAELMLHSRTLQVRHAMHFLMIWPPSVLSCYFCARRCWISRTTKWSSVQVNSKSPIYLACSQSRR